MKLDWNGYLPDIDVYRAVQELKRMLASTPSPTGNPAGSACVNGFKFSFEDGAIIFEGEYVDDSSVDDPTKSEKI